MAVFFNIDQLPTFQNAVLTIGTFDGVHLGHQQILKTLTDKAKELSGESIVITFDPHPRKLLFPDKDLKILTPLKEKIKLLSALGINHIIVVPFTKAFSQFSAQQYIQEFLVERFQPHTIVIGYDHHFGSDRKGNIHLLKQEQEKYNYSLIEISEQLVNEISVSSTKIRNALFAGNVKESAAMMGRYYSLKGIVVKGKQLGRTIGYPTANIDIAEVDQLLPAVGIYCVKVVHDAKQYNGMLSIGYNPTVTDERTIKIEVNIFDFNREIYGDSIEVLFVDKMRDEQKFESLEALKNQLADDEINAKSILSQI